MNKQSKALDYIRALKHTRKPGFNDPKYNKGISALDEFRHSASSGDTYKDRLWMHKTVSNAEDCFTDVEKKAFESGFIKAAMAEGLNHNEAVALYKLADGGLDAGSQLVHNLMTQQMQTGGSNDLLNQTLLGGGAGALGGGMLGALSADEEKGQSKWKRGFGGALAGGGLGALAGGGMKLNDQFNQAKDTAHSQLVEAGRSNLSMLNNPGNFKPTPGTPPLNDPNQNIRALREMGGQVDNASLLQSLMHQTRK